DLEGNGVPGRDDRLVAVLPPLVAGADRAHQGDQQRQPQQHVQESTHRSRVGPARNIGASYNTGVPSASRPTPDSRRDGGTSGIPESQVSDLALSSRALVRTGIAALPFFGLLKVHGADATTFLQAQLTN